MTIPDDEKWIGLEGIGRRRRHRRGERLFHEGDPAGSVMLVRSGNVKVSVLTPNGREIVLAVKAAGDLLGELSAIDGRPRSATATALDEVDVDVVSAAQFEAFVYSQPAAARRLLRSLAAQLRTAGRQRAERDEGTTVQRVARRLMALTQQFIEHNGPEATIELALTQDDLAGWVGATREATNRALAQISSGGCISTGRSRVTIVDAQALGRFTA